MINEINKMGGMTKAVEKGYPKLKIEEAATQSAIQNGLAIHYLDAEEEAAWHAVSAPLREFYIQNAGDIGKQLVAAADELRDNLRD